MRKSARASGRFSKREMVGCEQRSASPGKRPIASLNIGSRRRRSGSLPPSRKARSSRQQQPQQPNDGRRQAAGGRRQAAGGRRQGAGGRRQAAGGRENGSGRHGC